MALQDGPFMAPCQFGLRAQNRDKATLFKECLAWIKLVIVFPDGDIFGHGLKHREFAGGPTDHARGCHVNFQIAAPAHQVQNLAGEGMKSDIVHAHQAANIDIEAPTDAGNGAFKRGNAAVHFLAALRPQAAVQ